LIITGAKNTGLKDKKELKKDKYTRIVSGKIKNKAFSQKMEFLLVRL
jgi:hypothetical protein